MGYKKYTNNRLKDISKFSHEFQQQKNVITKDKKKENGEQP